MAQDQNVVLLIDANASLNDEAGIHCGGSEATKENVAATALKELVAERALCIPQTFSKFGPTWRNRRLDFIAVPLDWHAAVSDIKVEPPELLAINDFVDHRAVTITVTLRRETCQSRERRLNFERAAILTPEAKAQFESILGPGSHAACDLNPGTDRTGNDHAGPGDTSGSLPAGDPHAEAAMDNCVFMGRDPGAFHRAPSVLGERQDAEGGGQEGGLRSERDEGVVAGRNAIAEARLETARLGRLLQPLARSARRAVSQDKAEWLKRRSARIRAEAATGSSRTLWHLVRQLSGSKKARGPKPVVVIAAEERGRDCGSVGKHLLPRVLRSWGACSAKGP